jgi:hypothetical protein
MCGVQSYLARRAGLVAFAALVVYVSTAANAQTAEPASAPAGHINFNETNLPPATIEVDLSAGMFSDLFGLGDAAVAGVAETLLKSAGADDQGMRLAAEQLAAARQIMQLASQVVREVRVRVYEDLPEDAPHADVLMSKFDEQLREGNWENVARVRERDSSVRVSLLRQDGAVRGAFVVVADGDELVLANVVGDISPDNVKQFTAAAAKIGLENGLQPILEAQMRQLPLRRARMTVTEPYVPGKSEQPK